MSYAGDITPEEAWKLLNDNPEAVLVDCRTDAEWRFVGVPDLSSLQRDVVYVEWNSTDGKHNDDFVDDLVAEDRRSRAPRNRGRWSSCVAPVIARSAPPRPRPRRVSPRPTTCWTDSRATSTSTSIAAAPDGKHSACPGSSHEPTPSAVRQEAGRVAGRGQPGHHRGAGRAIAVGFRGDRGGDVPDLRVCVLVCGGGGEGVHRRDRPLRLLALRQPDDLDVRGAPAADRRRARVLCDGDGHGGGVHLAGCVVGGGRPVGGGAQPVRVVLRGVQRDPAALGHRDGVRRRR